MNPVRLITTFVVAWMLPDSAGMLDLCSAAQDDTRSHPLHGRRMPSPSRCMPIHTTGLPSLVRATRSRGSRSLEF